MINKQDMNIEEVRNYKMDNCIENAIEFIKDEKRATVTFSQGDIRAKSGNWLRATLMNARLWQKIRMVACAHIFRLVGFGLIQQWN